jgi:glycosyltransferase involved in cell wall biosynthesis
MRVGLSLLTLVPGEVGGAETSARGLARGLAQVGTLAYTAFVPPAAPGAGEGLAEVLVTEYRHARTIPQRALAMALATFRPGPLRRRYAEIDLVHYPLTIAVPPLELPSVVTVHDLQHLDLPHLFSRSERLFRRRAHEGSARRAAAVVVASQFVRRSVVERLGLPPERVHAIPWGVDHERFSPADVEREGFLLYPGRPWPHKNHERLFAALALLRRERPGLELVLTGGGHDRRPVPDGVRVAGLVSADELVSLYRRAACLVFPSLYEGFGQPPLEAMACGCPVACSRAAALPEAVGDAAALFDPEEPEDIAAVVGAVLESPERLVAAGLERARRFTWAETARRHEAVYGEVYRAVAERATK